MSTANVAITLLLQLKERNCLKKTHGHVCRLKDERAQWVQQVRAIGARSQRQTQVGQQTDQTLRPQVLVWLYTQR